MNEIDDKIIFLPNIKIPRKRKITNHPNWRKDDTHQKEKDIFLSFFENENERSCEEQKEEQKRILDKQIKTKIDGYKIQDKKKNLWNQEKFIHMEFIKQKLKESELSCFYCKETIRLWYDYVLDPKQWTLERIDNEYGHNIDNIEIACLSCNRKRRCMFHERFRFTKQIKFVKV
jgi:hypothetical protein